MAVKHKMTIYSRGLKHADRMWPTRAFCAARNGFSNFLIIYISVT